MPTLLSPTLQLIHQDLELGLLVCRHVVLPTKDEPNVRQGESQVIGDHGIGDLVTPEDGAEWMGLWFQGFEIDDLTFTHCN